MSQAIKFHRVESGTTPTGGWKRGHVYFEYKTGGTGVLKVCTTDSTTTFIGEDYTQVGANNHNHSSNQITSMTGYSIGASGIDTAPIATGDTLNAAIGKLEKTVSGLEAILASI